MADSIEAGPQGTAAPDTSDTAVQPQGQQSQSLLESLTAEQRSQLTGELTTIARGIFQTEVEGMRKELASARKENTRLRNMGDWDDSKKARYESDEVIRQEAVEFYVARGVPEEAFELADTPKRVKAQAELWLRYHVPTSDDISKKAAQALAIPNGANQPNPAERLMPVGTGRTGRGRNITQDNIDELYVNDQVTDDEYRTFRLTGKLPS